MDLTFKFTSKIKENKIIKFNGSKISEIGSITSLKKLKISPGKDLDNSNKKISRKLKRIKIIIVVYTKHLIDIKKSRSFKSLTINFYIPLK
tara:strand:+ start:172 stop:444 length:273 start_codon:yes stop_codon:yes gene_type:complete